MTTSRLGRTIGMLATFAAFSPVAAQQSQRIVITPYAGAYVPVNDVARVSAGVPGFAAAVTAKHKASFAYGANASLWLSDRAALEIGGAYAVSDLRTTGALINDETNYIGTARENAHVILGSAKLMFHLLPPENKFNIRLGLGPAVISRGGSAYKADAETKVTGLTDVGAAMSLCTRIPVANNFGIRLRAENYMYQAKMKLVDKLDATNNFSFDQRLQNDFLFSAGLQFTINR